MWISPNQPFIDGLSIINHPFWGSRILGNSHMSIIFRLSKVSKGFLLLRLSKVFQPIQPIESLVTRLELSEFQREVVDHGARKLHDLGIQPILVSSPWRLYMWISASWGDRDPDLYCKKNHQTPGFPWKIAVWIISPEWECKTSCVFFHHETCGLSRLVRKNRDEPSFEGQ